jgi:hypothetical protein
MGQNHVTSALQETVIIDEMMRLSRIQHAWAAYNGDVADSFKIKPGKPNDNVKPNFAEIIVDKGVGFLFGDELTFEVEGQAPKAEGVTEGDKPATPASDENATQWLKECWEENKSGLTLLKLATNGGVAGHVFIKIVPAATTEGFPRLVVLDPATITPFWMPEDIEDVYKYQIQFNATDPESGKPLVYRQIIQRLENGQWEIVDMHADPDGRAWITDGAETWPYSWPPIVECQNLPAPNEYWGKPDLTGHIIELILALNFTLSNLLKIIRIHAHPKTWGKGFDATQLKINADGIISIPTKDGEIHNLEMTSDLESSVKYYMKLKEALHEISRVPEVATGKIENLGALSGLALKILYGPLVEKTKTKRKTYGPLIRSINRRLLELGNFGANRQTVIKWPEILPQDVAELINYYTGLQGLGVSKRTALQKLGFDPTEEAANRKEEAAEAFATQQRVGLGLMESMQ